MCGLTICTCVFTSGVLIEKSRMIIYNDILEIKQAHARVDGHFFDTGAMRGFKSIVLPRVYGGRYFITSERFTSREHVEPRRYTVCECVDGNINRVTTFNTLSSYKAVQRATALGIENMKAHKPFQVTATNTIGCYGTDAEGNVWATFTRFGTYTPCAFCGEAIQGGYACGKLGEEKYYCARHVNYIQAQTQKKGVRK